MVWEGESGAGEVDGERAIWFRFRVEGRNGSPATGLEPYMGMAGHAVFMRTDGEVFAHVHPAGSVSMAAAALANGEMAGMDMGGMHHGTLPPGVSFSSGFSPAGRDPILFPVKEAGGCGDR